jgi:hypothetical protein
MAGTVLNDVKVQIASTDFANKASAVTIEGDAETQDTTGFGDTNRTFAVGFKNWRATINYYDQFADNDLNELLFGWWGTSQTIAITKADTTVSTTNPKWTGYVLFTQVPLFNASVGQISGGTLTLQGSGTLTRNVS